MNKKDLSGLNCLCQCYMSVGKLEKKQKNTKKPKTTPHSLFANKTKAVLRPRQAVLYQTPLQNLTLIHSILLPQTPVWIAWLMFALLWWPHGRRFIRYLSKSCPNMLIPTCDGGGMLCLPWSRVVSVLPGTWLSSLSLAPNLVEH